MREVDKFTSDGQEDNILSLLKEKGDELARVSNRGIILQPGAIGDCILTLPLVEFMKECLGLGGIDILGHTEYIGILPGRACVDGIRSIDSIDLHRLFTERKTFDLADGDPLINTFSDYTWIVTFLGEPDSDFEQNLIFTAHCSRSAEVITLSQKPPEKLSTHITDFYIEQFVAQSNLSLRPWRVRRGDCLIKATKADVNRGREVLEDIDVDFSEKLVVIHPGSGGVPKRCHLDNFLSVARELVSNDIKALFLLGPAEQEQFSDEAIKNITGVAKCLTDLSLTEVLGLLSCADGFVGNDSGITHLAAALGVSTLAVFGPTNPDVYRPIGPSVTVFTGHPVAFAKEPSEELQQELLKVLLA
ncbi:MAG: glycosyltransferase family 9 protein [Planctomycetota bacterium]|nr:MAG: glycosyltransferase family 9 protein [Planctomycetota bacterium]